ncbi:hypothetical protein FAZ79_01115 [Guyparkeria sp. SB14A]|uniref:hypothetical protein n=1 Tax=Guyparkeria sp. SB14A TaxID=2571147 RepID=UPI0010AC5E79|nr:hypothetical protein [Guyparkeria sp. SB14A]TKA91177.1 hypothetical protein FAZ79_01115 [Guyparkeria sp. SB14A]
MNDVFGKQDFISIAGDRIRVTPTRSAPRMTSVPSSVNESRPNPAFTASLTLTLTITATLAASLWSIDAFAAGSRAAVEARPGEIVLQRAVPTRHAARAQPPGRALLIDPSPRSEMEQGLSHLEISPGGYGQVAAGAGNGPSHAGGMGGSITTITQQLGGSTHGRHSAPSVAGGAIGSATGSIGSTVTGALSGAGLLGQGGTR